MWPVTIINLNSSLCVWTGLQPHPCEPAEMAPTLKSLGWNHAGGADAIFCQAFSHMYPSPHLVQNFKGVLCAGNNQE